MVSVKGSLNKESAGHRVLAGSTLIRLLSDGFSLLTMLQAVKAILDFVLLSSARPETGRLSADFLFRMLCRDLFTPSVPSLFNKNFGFL
jgi:hypothetical protein